ncbi:MAG: hypothetical protein OXF52_04345, partial [Candidatus Dadabacteria bacterium]|nr:hypothetical protein [Candidatus Dadabacteria bacterium]
MFILILIGKYEHYLPIDIPTGSIVNTDGFLIAIASISGIFLGLYFTAISSITSNYLLRAPIDVKNFFLAGPQGKQYMYIIKITAITSIFCIASSKLFGVKIGLFALMFLSLSVIYIVARFWSIGVDVFNSLEPQNALPWITKDILDSIQSVNPPGFQWNKPAIQNHHKNLTNNALNLINNLISFGSKEMKVSDEQLILALNYIGVVLYKYSDLKKKIPTTSLWYETKIQFRDWDTSPFFETHMALRTGTTLSPQTVKDHTWFEERILNIAVMVLDQFSEKRKPEVFLQGYSIFANIAEKYGNSLDTESLKMLFRKLDETEKFMSLINTDKDSKQQEINKVSFADLQGRLCSISIVGLLKYLKTSDNIDQKISNINWNHSSGIYKSGLPHTILSELESTLEKLTNEKTIEEKYVSNQWYIKMLCVQKYLFSLQQHFEYLKSLHNDFFRPRVNNLIQKKQWRSASQLILRWIECSNKYSLLVSSMEEHVADCSKLQRVKDFPWPEF